MKKQLLLASLIIGIVTTHSQNNQVKPSGSITNMAEKLASKYEVIYTARENENKPVNTVKPIGPQYGGQSNKVASTTINWTKISRSMNIYGMLEITSKPLQYNQELNTVSFVHRKSDTYVSSPVATPSTAASGVIVGMVSTNCGASWDSTCIWNNNTYWARFPQGGIYNPPGNTNLSNAYIVATGPLTQASNNWWGSYLASKKLDSPGGSGFNNIASTVTAAQQQAINTNTSSPLYRFDFPSLDFSTSQDGIVKSLGLINRDFNATGSGRQFRGGRVLYGAFNSGVFNWTSDSIVADQLVVTTSGGDKQLFGQPHMAWNESGTVGYVMLIGCRLGRTGSNRGFQPIIFKTTDGGLNWNEIPSIDFNLPIFKSIVLDRIQPVVTNSNLAIPMFNLTEGIACVVDKNDRLHIVSTIIGTRNEEADSLGFIYNFNNFDGEKYDFAHVPGARPYIYDFMQTGNNGWNVEIVDSMSSEAPGERPTNNGYNDNPWDPAGGNSGTDKVSSCARIQTSRTVDGKYIVYSWAESDSNFTNNGRKWNSIPNVKMRAYSVDLGIVSTNEINLTSANAFISSRAQMHHVAPTCGLISENLASTIKVVDLKVPVTVSTNQSVPLTQLLPNDHWYTCAQLTFKFGTTGIDKLSTKQNSTLQSNIYPNPASSKLNISVQLKQSNNVKVQIVNLLGETVNSHVFKGEAGDNTLGVDLKDFTKGVYFVTIQSGNGSSSHKLIVD